jgi:uncharacterized protein YndB with AHSA1/START domain
VSDLDPDLVAAMKERWVRVTRELDAPPDRVFRAWSDPDELAGWLPRTVEGSLAVGARTILTWHDRRIPIDVLEADPPTKFRFRWGWHSDGSYRTDVTVRIDRRGYGSKMTLTDGPFDLTVPGVIDAYAEALEGWGEAISGLRAQVDFSVDLRREVR